MTNIFDHTTTRTKQGDVGESRAIYEYTRLGYTVCVPIADSAKFDLIVEKEGTIKRIQVKTCRTMKKYGSYEVFLVTTGGNTKKNTRRLRHEDDYDELFVLVSDDRCWMIPTLILNERNVTTSISVGKDAYKEYEVT